MQSEVEIAAEDRRGSPLEQRVGLLIADAAQWRLMEGVVIHLDLEPVRLREESLTADQLTNLEMVIADERLARRVRALIHERQTSGEELKPALVALVTTGGQTATASARKNEDEAFDAVLTVPEKPALLSAQLGVALYAHRAFAQRYQSALEELNLNRNIFRSVTSGISVADARKDDLPLMYVNPAFEVMTGYSLEEVQGKNCRFLQKEDRDQPGLTLIRESIAKKHETIAVIKNYRKDGSFFWNELAMSPIRNREGQVTHFVGIQMDVTERVEFESALRESEKLAAVGRLASTIAHEINNPLEAVTNLVYLAQGEMPKGADGEESKRYLEQADVELRRIKLITAQSLRFYKQSHGPEAATAEELLQPLLDIYGARFTNFGIAVEDRNRSSSPIVCLASEIRQVLTNLITNAIDATKEVKGKILIRTQEGTDWETGREGVRFTVADNGHGMSRATQNSIFRAFYTTKGISGTGLGLWISQEIVERHGGRLSVRSSQHMSRRGTVFVLFLPLVGALAETRKQATPQAASGA